MRITEGLLVGLLCGEADMTPERQAEVILEALHDRPKIVTLCGSTRFKREFIEMNAELTMQGVIVLSVGFFAHDPDEVYTPSPSEKRALDELHKRKIDLSDEILVLNVGGYVGESTRGEIEYARSRDVPVHYLEEPS